MERDRRSSRLPGPHFPFCRRRPGISISGSKAPLRRTLRVPSVGLDDNEHPARNDCDDSVLSFATELSDGNLPAIVQRDGAGQFSRPITPIVTQLEKSSPTWPLPKSCTLHVFSGLPTSLSRSSLIPSPGAYTSSSTSSFSGATNTSLLPVSKQSSHASHIPIHISNSRLSLGSSKNEQQHTPRDAYIVYTAQPSAYWTGRFVALRDRFRSDALSPKNMQSLLYEQPNRAQALSHQRQERRKKDDDKNHRFNTRLPPSVTSAAILQHSRGGRLDYTEVLALNDDEERCRRVFVHLEAFCATDEARRSLRHWQQDYARKTGRKELLPEGGSMDTRFGGGSYFTRIMGARRMGKRASVV